MSIWVEWASAERQRAGELVSGDAHAVVERDGRIAIAVIDGLGHGPAACEVALQVVSIFRERALSHPVGELMVTVDAALRGGRGAAASLLEVDFQLARLSFCGVGNVDAKPMGPTSPRLVPTPGVLGRLRRPPKAVSLAVEPGQGIVLYTDGISSRFDAAELGLESASAFSTRILGLFGKLHDDATIVAIKIKAR